MSQENPPSLPQVGTGHYVVLCGLCLAVIFLVQLQQALVLTNLLGVLVGALSLVARMRLGPVLLVIFVAGAQLSLQTAGWRGRPEAMDLTDVVLCSAALGFVVSHYRLQAIWYNLLPADPRQRAGKPRRAFPWIWRRAPVVEEKRPADQITPQEIGWLVATLPLWAVAAQLAWALIPQRWEPLGIPARLAQILTALWLLTISFVVVRALLNFWKQRRYDPAIAQLYLQDLLWRDTRGEQRRVGRWLAWWKLARKKDGN
jgi:hypothetical protein